MAGLRRVSWLTLTLLLTWSRVKVSGEVTPTPDGYASMEDAHSQQQHEGRWLSGGGREKRMEMVTQVGRLLEVQLSPLLEQATPETTCDISLITLQDLPPWLLHDRERQLLHGVPSSRDTGQSSTVTLLCPSQNQAWTPLAALTISVTPLSSDGPPRSPSTIFSGDAANSSPLPQFLKNESSVTANFERNQDRDKVIIGNFSDRSSSPSFSQTLRASDEAERMEISESGQPASKVNTAQESKQCAQDYIAGLVLCLTPDQLNASHRVQVVKKSAEFLSVHTDLLTWRMSIQGQFHFTNQGYTMESGGASDHSSCSELVHSELSWTLPCSASRHVDEFAKILQHNVQVGRIEREIGVELIGWYLAAKTPRGLHRRRRRQVQNRTPVPTPTLYPPSATISFSSSEPSVDFTGSLYSSTVFSSLQRSVPLSQPSLVVSSTVSSKPLVTSSVSDIGVSSMEPTPSITRGDYIATGLELAGFQMIPDVSTDVVSTSAVLDTISVTPASLEDHSPSALQTSMGETSSDASQFQSSPVTPTPELSSTAVDKSAKIEPRDSVLSYSSFYSRVDVYPIESGLSLIDDSVVSMSQSQQEQFASLVDTVDVSQPDDISTSPIFLSSSGETLVSATQLDMEQLPPLLGQLNSTEMMELSELSSSVQSFSMSDTSSFIHTSSSLPAGISSDAVSDTMLPSLFASLDRSQTQSLMPTEAVDPFSPRIAVSSSVLLTGRFETSAFDVSEDMFETSLAPQEKQSESDIVVSSTSRLQTSFDLSYSTMSELTLAAPSIKVSATSTLMTDIMGLSELPTSTSLSQLSSQILFHQNSTGSDQIVSMPTKSTLTDLASASESVDVPQLFASQSVDMPAEGGMSIGDVSPSISVSGLPSVMLSLSLEHFPSSSDLSNETSYISHAVSGALPDKTSLQALVRSSTVSDSMLETTTLRASQTFSPITPSLSSVAEDDRSEVISVDEIIPESSTESVLLTRSTSASDVSSVILQTSAYQSYFVSIQPSMQPALTSTLSVADSSSVFFSLPVESSFFVPDEVSSSFVTTPHVSVELESPLDHISEDRMEFSVSQTMSLSDLKQSTTSTLSSELISLSTELMPSSAVFVETSTVSPTGIFNASDISIDSASSFSLPETVTVSVDLISSESEMMATTALQSEAVSDAAVDSSIPEILVETTSSLAVRVSDTSVDSLVFSSLGSEPEPSITMTASVSETISSVFISTAIATSESSFVSMIDTTTTGVESTVSRIVASSPDTSFVSFVASSEVTSVVSSKPEIVSASDVTVVHSSSIQMLSSATASATVTTSVTSVASSPPATTNASSAITTMVPSSSSPSSSSTTTTTTSSTTSSVNTTSPSTVGSPMTTTTTTMTTTSTTTSVTSERALTTSEQTTDQANSTTVSSTRSAANRPPEVVNSTNYLSANLGRYLEWQVPRDLFRDPEDGDTRSLTLTLTLTRTKQPLPSNFWVQFDPVRQMVYGLPLVSDVDTGYHSVVITATDRGGLSARNTVNLYVNSSAFTLFTHSFVMRFAVDYSQLTQRRDRLTRLVRKVGSYYGDPSARSVTVLDVSVGSFVLSWSNSSLRGTRCPRDAIHTVLNRMVRADGTVRSAFRRHMGTGLKLRSISLHLQGACLRPPPQTTHPPTPNTGEGSSEIVTEVVLPVLIALLLLLLLAIVLLLLHRCRKSRGGSLETLDKELYIEDRSPVILPRDLPEPDFYSARPKKPVMLPADHDSPIRASSPNRYERYRKLGSQSRRGRPASYTYDGERAARHGARPVTVIFNNFDSLYSSRQARQPAYWNDEYMGRSPKGPYTSTTSV